MKSKNIEKMNFPFDTIKLTIGVLMIIFAVTPKLSQIIFRKKQ